MKRLKLFILIFCLTLSLPLSYVIWRTYQGLDQEEEVKLAFFAEALFDEMQNELALLVQQEESRRVDEYGHFLAPQNSGQKDNLQPSPLAVPPSQDYILGYLQNNPDGSFQTPLVKELQTTPPEKRTEINELRAINQIFNQKKYSIDLAAALPATPVKSKQKAARISKKDFAERYLTAPKQQKGAKTYLGSKKSRKEEISRRQALNLAQHNQAILQAPPPSSQSQMESVPSLDEEKQSDVAAQIPSQEMTDVDITEAEVIPRPQKFQVEVAPLQSVFINSNQVFIFRRIAINNQIFRQGFILIIDAFMRHLTAQHFAHQPMAQFTHLSLQVEERGRKNEILQSGAQVTAAEFLAQRSFPAPFNFMSASISSDAVPPTPARRALNIALIVLVAVMLLGMLTIYKSTHTMVEMSERRTQFVSSVTHELKTPLTNIRMYIEMLEQGIAGTAEREQEYFQVLGAESSRLARLINNVLELAKLEKKQRQFHMQEANLDDLLDQVRTMMTPKLEQNNVTLTIADHDLPLFAFDREAMIQILINLIENSIKFSRTSSLRQITITAAAQDGWAHIAVSDTGPGIPRKALKKVFDDFYRVDNDLTRTTGGTGIGLALVKKFVSAMGGRVEAINNNGPGCTIRLSLPLKNHRST